MVVWQDSECGIADTQGLQLDVNFHFSWVAENQDEIRDEVAWQNWDEIKRACDCNENILVDLV